MNSTPASAAYELILQAALDAPLIESLCIGLTWTLCTTRHAVGLAMSPGIATRTLPWPGTVAGRPAAEVARWLLDWNAHAAVVGLAAANALINTADNPLQQQAALLDTRVPGNLAVFEYFRPRLVGRKVVVIGRYPGLAEVTQGLDVTVLERVPVDEDLPDPAAEFVLPEADWVFLTSSSLANKTFPRLVALASDAVTVLMGPSTPWLSAWADFDIDFVAGVQVLDRDKACQIAAEGGGVRLFDGAVRYAVADISAGRLARIREQIAATFARRESLRAAMSHWYAGGQRGRFSDYNELALVEKQLSLLDTAYKRLWDATACVSSV